METKPYCFCFDCGQYIKPIEGVPQVCRNEKNSGGGATNQEILPATMVGRRRKFFISNRLKRLEKLNICRRQVI